MLGYKFDLGDIVNLHSRLRPERSAPDTLEIVALLPPREGVAQYRVRSEYEKIESVVTEDDIEIVHDLAANNNVPAHLRKH